MEPLIFARPTRSVAAAVVEDAQITRQEHEEADR